MSNSAHSDQWQGTTSRGKRLSRKLGERLTLERLEELLRDREAEDKNELD